MGLKLVDKTQTKRFERGEEFKVKNLQDEWVDGPTHERDGAWIELRTTLSKDEDATINDSTGFDRISTAEGFLLRAKAQGGDPAVFEILAVGWSLKPGKPEVADYRNLDATDATWVDECLSRAVAMARGEIEGKGDSPATEGPQRSGPTSSPAEGDPLHTD